MKFTPEDKGRSPLPEDMSFFFFWGGGEKIHNYNGKISNKYVQKFKKKTW